MSGPCQSRTQQKGMATKRHRTHKDVSILFPSLMFLCFFVAVPFIDALSQAPAGTVLEGVFSEVQANAGKPRIRRIAAAATAGISRGFHLPKSKANHLWNACVR